MNIGQALPPCEAQYCVPAHIWQQALLLHVPNTTPFPAFAISKLSKETFARVHVPLFESPDPTQGGIGNLVFVYIVSRLRGVLAFESFELGGKYIFTQTGSDKAEWVYMGDDDSAKALLAAEDWLSNYLLIWGGNT